MCDFCKNTDFSHIGFHLRYGTGVIYSGSGKTPEAERFKFCPVCGDPLTVENFMSEKERVAFQKRKEYECND